MIDMIYNLRMGDIHTAEFSDEFNKLCMEYGAMSMPALVINEKVVSVGRVLKPAEIVEIVEKY